MGAMRSGEQHLGSVSASYFRIRQSQHETWQRAVGEIVSPDTDKMCLERFG
jgi:hypothetical protein